MKTLAEKIAVMQAALEGKKIRQRSLGVSNWEVVSNPLDLNWSWGAWDYEVVPEPRVIYVNEYKCGLAERNFVHESLAKASRSTQEFVRTVKFVEVIE